MRKILVLVLAIPVFFLFIFGLILFDYVYFPLIETKAEKIAEAHLEEKYGEDFVIDETEFSKPLGDDIGEYRINAHPSNSPNITVRITVTEEMEPEGDDYVDMKWRAELNEQFGEIYKELYGTVGNYAYMLNVYFPEEAYTKYDIHSTYEEIFLQEHDEIGNIIFANILMDSSINDQLGKAYQLIQKLKNQELDSFSIDINYYNEKIKVSAKDKKLNYHDFTNKHLRDREYVFRFYYDSKDGDAKLDAIKSPADLEQYLIEK